MSIPPGSLHIIKPLIHNVASAPASVTWAVGINTTAQAALDSADDAFNLNWAPAFDNNVTLGAAMAYFRGSAGSPLQVATSTEAPVIGSLNQNSEVSSVALRVTKRTAFVGRGFRGRIYLPWMIAETGINELGVLVPAVQASYQTRANGWLTATNASGDITEMELLHAYDPALPVDPEIPATPINSLFVQPVCGTQRRRLNL